MQHICYVNLYVYNINRAENEGRLEEKTTGGRKRKIYSWTTRFIMRKIHKNPQKSTRTLAKDLKEECELDLSHETVRQTIIRHR